jgi:hypothetical protein
MNRNPLAGATALAFVALTSAAMAGDAQGLAPDWITSVAGQKLEAVDGSSILFSVSDRNVALAVTSPSGETQKNVFAMMNDKLGTVSDGANGDHLIGFFRTVDDGLEAQFADGHTEQLTMNAGGGISVMLNSAANGKACMAWYPHGHVFSDAERRTALAEYAQRLGVKDARIAPVSHSCDAPSEQKSASVRPGAQQIKPKDRIVANAKGLVPIMVRTSVVHAVDATAPAAAVVAPKAVAIAAPKAEIVAAAPHKIPTVSMDAMVQQASATTSDDDDTQEAAVEPGHGASGCLSVDNDGSDFGFRNQCGFNVEFSYCLESSDDPAIACDAGSRAGNVSANGFVPLLRGVNIKTEDAEHDVHWVGCTGSAQDVVAHLDKSDPPAGRCVRIHAT